MSSNDYIQYLTKQFVRYLDTPREERRQRRETKEQERWERLWFGDLAFGVQMVWRRWKERRKRKSTSSSIRG